jgi:hypothetical protein
MHGDPNQMLDVHPPHEPVHGVRDFIIHLLTITIGLLIAVGIEGCVEWQHHRHLVHEAEASLHEEIKFNANGMQNVIDSIHNQQKTLKQDLVVLQQFAKGSTPKDKSMSVTWRILTLDDVSWRTAQATGAFAYMPYADAREYANIYHAQEEYDGVQHQALRDATYSVALFVGTEDTNSDPTPEEAKEVISRMQVLQAQLLNLDSFATTLNAEYKKFLEAHPD